MWNRWLNLHIILPPVLRTQLLAIIDSLMAHSKPISCFQRFPYDIQHQIIDDIGAWGPEQLYQLLKVDKSCRSLVRQHPAWCGHLVLENTEKLALDIFNSQLIACKEHKRPTYLEVHLGFQYNTDIQDKIFVKLMTILPFTKTIILWLRLTDPQALWQRFVAIRAPQLESLHITLRNQQGRPEQLVLPAHPFSGQAPLLKDINALFDYSSLAVKPFKAVQSVCWEISQHQAADAFGGSNIVAHCPNARKLVFSSGGFAVPPDLFSGAPGLWRLEDVEIWGVISPVLNSILGHIVTKSIRRISVEVDYACADAVCANLISSCLPLGVTLTFKALCRKRNGYEELVILSLLTELGKIIELPSLGILDLDRWVYRMLMQSFALHLTNVTKLEFDLRLWNKIIKSNVPFSAVHTLVLHVTEKPVWELLNSEPHWDGVHESGLFPFDQSIHTPRITCLKIIGNATPLISVEETWITNFILTRVSGFDPTASPVVIRCLRLITADGTLNGLSGWSQLTIEDCEVLGSD
ncbi:hypothetical protein BKA62DRAFT_776743 [Auriculariales sp. MPI-PUGE-AT-0066]|nr:hypothetical protein BKA62DRAFT_776743 [Auriculariales sp. MPI-PUGE-AT-0066]